MTTGIDNSETPLNAHRVFAGLVPAQHQPSAGRENRVARGLLNTVPIVLVGSVAAVSMNLTAPVDTDAQKPPRQDTVKATSQLGKQIKQALVSAGAKTEPTTVSTAAFAAAQTAPSTYRVAAGDTVSSIAGRFGLSTASVLALNGLGWKSIIFPGQELKLTNGAAPAKQPTAAPKAAPPAASNRYTIAKGDTISGIAGRFGLSTQTLLSANGLGWSSIIYPGQTLAIPGTAAPAAAPAIERVSSTTPTTTGSHTIKRGDTISSIAKQYGLTMSALLQANNLTMSSVIYAGRTLSIPGASEVPVGNSVVPLTSEMRQNASIIVQVGQDLGVPDYGIVIALAAAAQESSMRNIDYGDRDSLGLFQQRPSAGWGTPAHIMNPAHAARLFYGGDSNPNKGVTRGLLEISGWQSMTLTQAAQAVQISAYPEAYAKWEKSARAWYDQLR
ncbi:LysM peptidoglycan-binding domain-containing protein [Diaminobutyricimonas sp. LJ205]|uniref:LysM peptidoglycan-binding domain-containing protein n=1 Tax=Diaminobutyricimonas sp. LJ205 TaxID=2683590 RepID=UPI0012F50DC2|nr:LysM peptidoglycan-binding domain-containing protein [Diaminobutyricimonas sp. LJ205]